MLPLSLRLSFSMLPVVATAGNIGGIISAITFGNIASTVSDLLDRETMEKTGVIIYLIEIS